MADLKNQLRQTLLLSCFLAFFGLTPWAGGQTGVNTFVWLLGGAVLIAVGVVFNLLWIYMLHIAPPNHGLLLSAESERDLLWRLASDPELHHYNWPWRLKRRGAWVGCSAGVATAVALIWYGRLGDQPFIPAFCLGVIIVTVSSALMSSRLVFEHWAKNHTETVEQVLNTPRARARLRSK